jgi:hypothetical protein
LRSALRIGEEQIEAGEGVVYSANRLDSITEKAFANARIAKEISSDIKG